MDEKLKQFFKERLKKPLPGIVAQKKMAPASDNENFRPFTPGPDARRSSVLLLISRIEGSFKILLTLRSGSLNSHRGQISFPGGKCEQDETPAETALRETFEEVGISREKIEILGLLSDLYIPPSNSIVSPFVGYLDSDTGFEINPDEVEEAFTLDIDFLLDGNNLKTEQWNFDGIKADIPLWHIGKKTPLWGATAMILSEFLSLYKEFEQFIGLK